MAYNYTALAILGQIMIVINRWIKFPKRIRLYLQTKIPIILTTFRKYYGYRKNL